MNYLFDLHQNLLADAGGDSRNASATALAPMVRGDAAPVAPSGQTDGLAALLRRVEAEPARLPAVAPVAPLGGLPGYGGAPGGDALAKLLAVLLREGAVRRGGSSMSGRGAGGGALAYPEFWSEMRTPAPMPTRRAPVALSKAAPLRGAAPVMRQAVTPFAPFKAAAPFKPLPPYKAPASLKALPVSSLQALLRFKP